jgi:phosphoglycolate phosphatase
VKLGALIFDLDGTLVDSLADIGAAMNRALASFGWPTHPLEAYRGFVGEGVDVLARKAMPAGQIREDLVPDLIAAYQRDYAVHMFAATRAYPGIAEVIASLRVPLAVLSNKPHAPTRAIAETLFPGRFRVVAGQRPGVPKKPDPTAALAIAAELGVAPPDCGYVGDTAVDLATARAAGMFAVGVAWGFRPEEVAASDRLLTRADELYELV